MALADDNGGQYAVGFTPDVAQEYADSTKYEGLLEVSTRYCTAGNTPTSASRATQPLTGDRHTLAVSLPCTIKAIRLHPQTHRSQARRAKPAKR